MCDVNLLKRPPFVPLSKQTFAQPPSSREPWPLFLPLPVGVSRPDTW